LGLQLFCGAIRVTQPKYNIPIGDRLWRWLVISLPYWWLAIFFLAPFAIVFKISFADPIIAQPPFSNFFDFSPGADNWLLATLDNYRFITEDSLYWISYFKSLKIAAISTVLCLLLGYPMAYGIAKCRPGMRNILLMLVILPFWTSFLLRVYAWIVMLGKTGAINSLLMKIGLIEVPLEMLYTDGAVYLGIVYTYIPFMILPLYSVLEKMDTDLQDAAADLGAKRWQVFLNITLPLSMPGVIAGSMLVFIPAVGEFVIPALLGGIDSLMIGRTLYDEFFINRDWPLASAVATVLLFIIVIPVMLFQSSQKEEAE
jgi:putrescine transport system permease protein